jgi:hypothetical protein
MSGSMPLGHMHVYSRVFWAKAVSFFFSYRLFDTNLIACVLG